MLFAATVLGVGLALPAMSADEPVDVVRYELEVVVRDADISVSASLHATARPKKEWRLELVPEMKVVSADSNGTPLPFTTAGSTLTPSVWHSFSRYGRSVLGGISRNG